MYWLGYMVHVQEELCIKILKKFITGVYICGGYDGTQIFDDLWEIDLKTLRWRCLPARLPLPVYFHAAAVTRVSLARTLKCSLLCG